MPDIPGNTSTTSLSFTSTNADYASAVTDVSFRINDVDVGTSCDYHQDIVTVRAYDAQGNLTDEKTRQSVADFIAGFAASIDT